MQPLGCIKSRPVTDVFAALADPVRRSLLDRLRRSGSQSLGQLAAPYGISRQAVTKHLDTLADSGLVTVTRRGRERLHHLNSAPLEELDDWLRPYAEAWDRRLSRLERHLAEHPEPPKTKEDEP